MRRFPRNVRPIVFLLAAVIACSAQAQITDKPEETGQPTRYTVSASDYEALEKYAKEMAAQSKTPDMTYTAILRIGIQELRSVDKIGQRDGSFSVTSIDPDEAISGLDDNLRDRALWQSMLDIGKRGGLLPPIVRGSDLGERELSETVALMSERRQICTGTVIANDTVLTAAHCVCDMKVLKGQDGIVTVFFGDPEAPGDTTPSVQIIKGETRLLDDGSDGGQNFCEKRRAKQFCGQDLAIVKFDPSKITITGRLPESVIIPRIATAAEGAQFLSGFDAVIAGYGLTSTPRNTDASLRALPTGAKLPKKYATALMPRGCGERERDLVCKPGAQRWGCNRTDEFVLGLTNAADTCNGDSGGPVFDRPNGSLPEQLKNQMVLMGVTSRGADPSEACGLGGIYGAVFSQKAQDFFDEVLDR